VLAAVDRQLLKNTSRKNSAKGVSSAGKVIIDREAREDNSRREARDRVPSAENENKNPGRKFISRKIKGGNVTSRHHPERDFQGGKGKRE